MESSTKYYVYTDRQGNPMKRTIRIEPYKKIHQEYWDGNSWTPKKPDQFDDQTCTPYRYTEWKNAETVYVVEGEKCVDAIYDIGLHGTTTGSSTSWKDFHSTYFKGKRVIIIPDKDTPGERYARNILDALDYLKIEAFILRLPNLEESEDVYDWVQAGGTRKDLLELEFKQVGEFDYLRKIQTAQSILDSDVPEPEWLVEGIIPHPGKCLLHSSPKVGKTRLSRFLSTCITDGKPFGEFHTKKGKVVFFAFEDLLPYTKEALEQLEDFESKEDLLLYIGSKIESPDFVVQLRNIIRYHQPILIIIDTIIKGLSIRDSNNYPEVSEALANLDRLSEKFKVSFLILHHSTKRNDGSSNSANGSIAWAGGVDTILELRKDNGDDLTLKIDSRYSSKLPDIRLTPLESGSFLIESLPYNGSEAKIEKKIKTILAENSVPISQQDLLKLIPHKKKSVLDSLNRLCESGEIVCLNLLGKSGKPCKHFAISLFPPLGEENGNERSLQDSTEIDSSNPENDNTRQTSSSLKTEYRIDEESMEGP